MTYLVACRLALAGFGLFAFANHASAAPIIVGSYYGDTKTFNCAAASDCFVEFADVPAGKLVTLTRIACSIRVIGPALHRVRLQIRFSNNAVSRAQDLTFVVTEAEGLETSHVVESNPFLLLGPTQNPSVRITTGGSSSTDNDCFIAGTVFNAP
jgi:hypothetical protein